VKLLFGRAAGNAIVWRARGLLLLLLSGAAVEGRRD